MDLDGLEEYKVLETVVVFKDMAEDALSPLIRSSTSYALKLSTFLNNLKPVYNPENNFGLGSITIQKIQDNTYLAPPINLMNVHKRIEEESFIARVFEKLGSWLDRVSHGSGSYQDYGIVFAGNDNGTMEFRDHAGKIIDWIDIGPMFGAFRAAGLDPKVFRELFESPGWIKYLGNLLEAGNITRESVEAVKEAVEETNEIMKPKKSTITRGPGGKLDKKLIFRLEYFIDSSGDTTGNGYYPEYVPVD